jgi:hypothetical protein
MPLRRKFELLFIALFLAPLCTYAQEAAPVRYGTWTASVSPSQIFRGSWSAEILPRNPNDAQGSWALFSDSGDVVLQGTWSAKKIGLHWHGTWRARTAQGQSFGGVWDADLPESKGETFGDMLTRTIEKEVAGSWQSGRNQGNWWLKGFKAKSGSRDK